MSVAYHTSCELHVRVVVRSAECYEGYVCSGGRIPQVARQEQQLLSNAPGLPRN